MRESAEDRQLQGKDRCKGVETKDIKGKRLKRDNEKRPNQKRPYGQKS